MKITKSKRANTYSNVNYIECGSMHKITGKLKIVMLLVRLMVFLKKN